MQPTILITRPDPDGQRFADQLRAALGCSVAIMLSPVLRFERCGELPDLDGVRQLIFTSRNAVEAYAPNTTRRDIPCYTVGDATADLARSIGLTAKSCGGDSDRLVARVLADGADGPCLHVRGEHGVGNIAARLSSGGVETRTAVLYRQVAQILSDEAKALLRGQGPVILPLFSPRSAHIVFDGTQASAPIFVVAMSGAVADVASGENIQAITVAERPDAGSMVWAVVEMVKQAMTLEGGNRAK